MSGLLLCLNPRSRGIVVDLAGLPMTPQLVAPLLLCARLRVVDEVAQMVQAGPQPMVPPRPAMKRMWPQDVAAGALTLQRTAKNARIKIPLRPAWMVRYDITGSAQDLRI